MNKNKIGFWKVKEHFGEFSNWCLCEFTYKGQKFTTSEQALMWEKAKLFDDKEVASKILKTKYQKEIKSLGREVKNYDDVKWASCRYKIMVDILLCKFSQNKGFKELLLSTRDNEIYEASPCDNVWGIGSDNLDNINGQNLLGKALMEVRGIILDETKNNK